MYLMIALLGFYDISILFQMIISKRKSMIALGTIFTIIVAVYLPTLFALPSSSEMDCYPHNNKFANVYIFYVWPVILTVVITAFPDVIFLVGNIAIIIHVQKHRLEVTSGGGQTTSSTSQGRVTRTAVTLSLTHLILTLPLLLYDNITEYMDNEVDIIHLVLSFIALANYGINIVIYIVTSQVFRQELIKLFHSLLPKQSADFQNSTVTITSNTQV